jgi:hypothetical protein
MFVGGRKFQTDPLPNAAIRKSAVADTVFRKISRWQKHMNSKAPEKRTKEDQCADFFYGMDTENLHPDSAMQRGLHWLGQASWARAQKTTEEFGSN